MSDPLKIERKKIAYIDHLRVGLTALVILHHAAVAYGAPGDWYYSQKTENMAVTIPMTLLVAVDQAFFMGFFFFLSALFVPSSYDKKGALKFVTDRLLRLGIPLMFYSFVLSPFLSYMVYYGAEGHHITYLQYLSGFDEWIGFGVMWFVAALLLFTLLYVAYRAVSGAGAKVVSAPTLGRILGFAILIGIISFAVRIVFPVGWVLEPVGFQLGHFPQYISMFVLGLIAARSKWLDQSDYQLGRRMRNVIFAVIIIGFPLFFIVKAALGFPLNYLTSGLHWQSLWFAVWEQIVGFGIVTALLCIGRAKWDIPSQFLEKLARTTFAAYIFHPLILIGISVLLHDWSINSGLKFLIVGPLAVVGTFLFASMLVRIPGLNKII